MLSLTPKPLQGAGERHDNSATTPAERQWQRRPQTTGLAGDGYDNGSNGYSGTDTTN